KRRDLAAISAVNDVDLRVPFHVAHEPDTTRAENAALAVEQERRTEVDVAPYPLAVEHAPRKLHPALTGAERIRKILQRTLAALVAHRTVERMVDEEKFKHAGARDIDFRTARRDHHPIRADGRA